LEYEHCEVAGSSTETVVVVSKTLKISFEFCKYYDCPLLICTEDDRLLAANKKADTHLRFVLIFVTVFPLWLLKNSLF